MIKRLVLLIFLPVLMLAQSTDVLGERIFKLANSKLEIGDELLEGTQSAADTNPYAYRCVKSRGTVDSPTAAVDGDFVCEIQFGAYNSTPAEYIGGAIRAVVDDSTAASEDFSILFRTAVAGTVADRFKIGPAPMLVDLGVEPTCAAAYRGAVWTDEGGAGVVDTTRKCQKNAADSYVWVDMLGSGGGYATIEDEGTPLTQRLVVNFIGTGITCVDNDPNTDCTITAGSEEYCAQTHVKCAHLQSGTTSADKIVNCLGALPADGGTCDARFLTATTWDENVVVDEEEELLLPSYLMIPQSGGGLTSAGPMLTQRDSSTVKGTCTGDDECSGFNNNGFITSGKLHHARDATGAGNTWTHNIIIENMLYRCDNSSVDGLEIHNIGENSWVQNITFQACDTCLSLRAVAGATLFNAAGGNRFQGVACFASQEMVEILDGAGGEVMIAGLSGDNNVRGMVLSNTVGPAGMPAIVTIDGCKTENPSTVMTDFLDIDSANIGGGIKIANCRHSGAAGINNYVAITNMAANKGGHIIFENVFLPAGMLNTTFIDDMTVQHPLPYSATAQQLGYWIYEFNAGDADAVMGVLRGAFKFGNDSGTEITADCVAGMDGQTYFNTTDDKLCICADDGTDHGGGDNHAWMVSDDYSHATGHCSNQTL